MTSVAIYGTAGVANRSFISGIRLCPPERSFASVPCLCQSAKASGKVVGAKYANGGGSCSLTSHWVLWCDTICPIIGRKRTPDTSLLVPMIKTPATSVKNRPRFFSPLAPRKSTCTVSHSQSPAARWATLQRPEHAERLRTSPHHSVGDHKGIAGSFIFYKLYLLVLSSHNVN